MDLWDGPLRPLHRLHSVSHSIMEEEPLEVQWAGPVGGAGGRGSSLTKQVFRSQAVEVSVG